jgi:hypothetical protein
MKKIIGILAIIISTAAFSQNQPVNHSAQSKGEKSGMTKQVSDLTPRQQKEYHAIHEKNMNAMKKNKQDIKEIEIQIQKEKHSKKPDGKKISMLTNKKSRLQNEQEKNMLRFKLEVKDRFGIKITDGMMSKGKSCRTINRTA